jgi:hypothetical protein
LAPLGHAVHGRHTPETPKEKERKQKTENENESGEKKKSRKPGNKRP